MKAKIDAEITVDQITITPRDGSARIQIKLHPLRYLRPHAPEVHIVVPIPGDKLESLMAYLNEQIRIAVENPPHG